MGFAKIFFPPKIRDYYGSGWVGPGLNLNFFGKSSQNGSKPVVIFGSSIQCVFCLYTPCTMLKVVTYYDLSVLSMSVMGFHKKVWMGGWVSGWVG